MWTCSFDCPIWQTTISNSTKWSWYKCEKYVVNEYKSRSSWFILEGQNSIPASAAELVQNPLEITDNTLQQNESKPLPIEIGEEKKKLIQKETVQTGSVRSTDQDCPLFNIP